MNKINKALIVLVIINIIVMSILLIINKQYEKKLINSTIVIENEKNGV